MALSFSTQRWIGSDDMYHNFLAPRIAQTSWRTGTFWTSFGRRAAGAGASAVVGGHDGEQQEDYLGEV